MGSIYVIEYLSSPFSRLEVAKSVFEKFRILSKPIVEKFCLFCPRNLSAVAGGIAFGLSVIAVRSLCDRHAQTLPPIAQANDETTSAERKEAIKTLRHIAMSSKDDVVRIVAINAVIAISGRTPDERMAAINAVIAMSDKDLIEHPEAINVLRDVAISDDDLAEHLYERRVEQLMEPNMQELMEIAISDNDPVEYPEAIHAIASDESSS